MARYLPGRPSPTPAATLAPSPTLAPAATSAAAAPPATPTPGQGQILFETDRDGNYEVYVMNEDGSGQRNLTNFWADDAAASWSPDGERIVFISWRTGVGSFKLTNGSAYAMDRDGSDLVQLTSDEFDDDWPTWGPSGQIAFATSRDGNSEIYAMGADGSGQPAAARLANLTRHPADDSEPNWSRRGDLIAFTSNRDGDSEIYVMRPDGSGQRNLTDHPGRDRHPVFSPDGRWVAFATDRHGQDELYLINVETLAEVRLTHNEAGDWKATWSPDGERIAFYSNREGDKEIYVMRRDGTGAANISRSPASEEFPSWSPNERPAASAASAWSEARR